MFFNFLSKRISKLSHYNNHSTSWYRKCKAVWCKELAIVIRLLWNINIQVKFSKNPQTFRDKLFIAEGQTERWMGMMSLTVAFRNFATSLETRHGYPDSFIDMCRLQRFFAVLRCFFLSSLLHTLAFDPSPISIVPSSLTSSGHFFLGLSLNLFFHIWYSVRILFSSYSAHDQTNIICLTLLSLYSEFFKLCIKFLFGYCPPIFFFTVKYWA